MGRPPFTGGRVAHERSRGTRRIALCGTPKGVRAGGERAVRTLACALGDRSARAVLWAALAEVERAASGPVRFARSQVLHLWPDLVSTGLLPADLAPDP